MPTETGTIPLARGVAPDLEAKAHPDALARAREVARWLRDWGIVAESADADSVRVNLWLPDSFLISAWQDADIGVSGCGPNHPVDDLINGSRPGRRDKLHSALLKAGVLRVCSRCGDRAFDRAGCHTCNGTGVVPAEAAEAAQASTTTSSPSAESPVPAEQASESRRSDASAEGGVCFACGQPFSAYRPNRAVGGKGQGTCGDCLAPTHANPGDLDTRIAAARAAHRPEPERRHPHTPEWPSQFSGAGWEE